MYNIHGEYMYYTTIGREKERGTVYVVVELLWGVRTSVSYLVFRKLSKRLLCFNLSNHSFDPSAKSTWGTAADRFTADGGPIVVPWMAS